MLWVDRDLARTHSVALRGDIESLTPAGDLLVAWTTQGVMAALTPNGEVAWSGTIGWGEQGVVCNEWCRSEAMSLRVANALQFGTVWLTTSLAW